jgi:hypothetical protein
MERKIYACGTLRSNRRNFPAVLKPHIKKGLSKRGDFIVQQLSEVDGVAAPAGSKSISVSLWQDNRPVIVASSNTDPQSSSIVQRRQRDGSRKTLTCPTSIEVYNKYMGGVDLNDQLRGYYSVRLKGRKFYKYIWWFVFDVAVTNSFILFKHYSDINLTSVKDFRSTLAKELIGKYNGRKKAGRPSTTMIQTPSISFDHFPKQKEKRSRCYQCYHEKKKRHDTSWHCDTCDKYLCHNGKDDDCFVQYHKQIM